MPTDDASATATTSDPGAREGLGTALLRRAAYVALGLAGLALFARFTVASGFDAFPGNAGDARFVLYVCEHWHEVFSGTASWLSPRMFHPLTGVLGYSEALFALGAAYSVLRRLGLDPFTAYQLVVLALPFAGYVGALLLLRRGFGLGPFASVVGALLFAYSSPLATSMAHAQLEAVAFAPYLALLLAHWLARLGSRDRAARASGLALAILFPLLAYTSFYIAWFFALFAFLAVLVATAWLLARRRLHVLRAWVARARGDWRGIAATALVLAVASVPFAITYAPALRRFARRPFVEEVLPGLPSAIDLVNVGFENLVWGRLLRRIAPDLQTRPGFWELDKGIPLVLLAIFLAVTVRLLRRAGEAEAAQARPAVVPAEQRGAVLLLLAATVVLAWVLMVKIGDHSLWRVVYRRFPGGGAVRSVFRFDILLALPIVAVASHGLDRLWRRAREARSAAGTIALCALAVLLVAEEHNEHRDVLGKREERALLASVPAPPPFCRSMVVTADHDPYAGWWAPLQLHAMLVSQRFDLPTVNGYSGWTPPDWDLHFPTAPGYEERVRRWATAHDVVEGLCAYHYDTRSWRPFRARPDGKGRAPR